jgi:hypothetical protein
MYKRSSQDTDNDPPAPKRQRQTVLSNSLTPTIPTLPLSATVSSPIDDRKSRFVGYFIPLKSSSLLPRQRTLLETLPELALADHKIMAWKIGQTSGFHDDGEKWAGRKVLDILIASEDEGLLCVARWYGGIMLGPARFDHIVHVAADALATYHLSLEKSPVITTSTMTAPRIISSESDEERGRLVRMLRGKDMTVENLRGTISGIKSERGELSQQSPVKEKNYERMGMDGLKRLVIARDATIQSLRDILRELSASVSESPEKATQGSASHDETGSYTEGTKDLK